MANRYIVRLRATDAEDPEQRKTIDSEVVDSQADNENLKEGVINGDPNNLHPAEPTTSSRNGIP